MAWIVLVSGFFLLLVGAELLVRSSVQIALYYRLSKLLIGLTVVAFCTSAPEAVVSVIAQFKGASGDLALGNVLGSNIMNASFVLGLYLLLRPCDVTQEMKKQKMPLLFVVYLLVFFTMLGGRIHRIEGIFLLIALILYIALQFYLPPKRAELKEEIHVHDEKVKRPKRITFQILGIVAASVLLILGSKMMIDSSLILGKHYGISERVIGISLIAFGTSLPELATAIIAAFRKQQEIMVGTIIGSNIFNPLLIIPLATFVKPLIFSQKMLLIDFPIMVVFSILLWVLMILGKDRLSRIDGVILLLAYFSYITYLYA